MFMFLFYLGFHEFPNIDVFSLKTFRLKLTVFWVLLMNHQSPPLQFDFFVQAT
jgi:hypothetical protein